MRLGIIIPYRNREDHLKFTAPILKRYGQIYVIEQMDDKPFNRGKLINVGYKYFKDEMDYICAHDVDAYPGTTIDYSFSEIPCHLAAESEQFNYRIPYKDYFGGVTLFPNDKFEKVNGFSNEYWGWGGEDDEIRRRFTEMNIEVTRRAGQFKSLHHIRVIDKALLNENRNRLKAPVKWGDGLTSCEFEIISITTKEHYKLLQVML